MFIFQQNDHYWAQYWSLATNNCFVSSWKKNLIYYLSARALFYDYTAHPVQNLKGKGQQKNHYESIGNFHLSVVFFVCLFKRILYLSKFSPNFNHVYGKQNLRGIYPFVRIINLYLVSQTGGHFSFHQIIMTVKWMFLNGSFQ